MGTGARMISSGSTIAFEGMLLGATAIVYEPLSIFSANIPLDL